MACDRGRRGLLARLPHPGRALDVGQEQGDRAGRELGFGAHTSIFQHREGVRHEEGLDEVDRVGVGVHARMVAGRPRRNICHLAYSRRRPDGVGRRHVGPARLAKPRLRMRQSGRVGS